MGSKYSESYIIIMIDLFKQTLYNENYILDFFDSFASITSSFDVGSKLRRSVLVLSTFQNTRSGNN